MYIDAGVPIYPRSLGHSYHTLVWRLGIESQEIQRQRTELSTEEIPIDPIDRFYDERPTNRTRERYDMPLTYLEEKSLHKIKTETNTNSIPPVLALNVGRESAMDPANLVDRLLHTHTVVPNASFSIADSLLLGRNAGLRRGRSTSNLSSKRRLKRSTSQSDLNYSTPKPLVKVHRHLLDQHLLGRPSIDDNDGKMMTPTLSLSADFFHPHFSFLPPNSREQSLLPEISRNDAFSESTDSQPHNANLPLHGLVPPIDDNVEDSDDLDSEGEEEANQIVDAFRQNPADPANEPLLPSPDATRAILSSPVDSTMLTPKLYNVLSNIDLEVYSVSSTNTKAEKENSDLHRVKKSLRGRFDLYKQRLDTLLRCNDMVGFEECMLDFWDEFLSHTALIHYYDRKTPVPRASSLSHFMTTPCPKAIGIVQCEIERIKLAPKKKGVNMKGRLFPTYEYRLFIRHDASEDSEAARKDTILMTAKNKGRKHADANQSSNKKGSNNYYLCLPQQDDVDKHYKDVNLSINRQKLSKNGAGYLPKSSEDDLLLGRLQSNFIGTEFQIFTTKKDKKKVPLKALKARMSGANSKQEFRLSDHNPSSSRRKNKFGRLSLRRSGTAGEIHNHPTSIESGPNETFVMPSMNRSRSLGEVPIGRQRPSRRAIANNNDVFAIQRPQPVVYENEIGAITYTANLLGSRPRIMDVCIPKVSSDGTPGLEWKKYLDMCNATDITVGNVNGGNHMLNRLKYMQHRQDNDEQNRETPTNDIEANALPDNLNGYSPPDDFGLLALQNRPPWWNVELGSFVLNFGGRVSVASVKNFQLCERSDQDYIMLQFGRIQGRHSFTMDFQHPLTAVQAFAIAISSLQSKISFG